MVIIGDREEHNMTAALAQSECVACPATQQEFGDSTQPTKSRTCACILIGIHSILTYSITANDILAQIAEVQAKIGNTASDIEFIMACSDVSCAYLIYLWFANL
jgi:hypothetical protein